MTCPRSCSWFLAEQNWSPCGFSNDSLQRTRPPEDRGRPRGDSGAVGGLPHWLQEAANALHCHSAQPALSPGSHSFYPIPQALTKNRQWCRPRYTGLTDKTSPTAPGKTRLLPSLLFFLLILCKSRRRALQRVCVSFPGAASCLTCWAGFRRQVWEETPPGDADTLCWSWKTSHTVKRF